MVKAIGQGLTTVNNYQHLSFGEQVPRFAWRLGNAMLCLTVPSTMPVLPIFKEKQNDIKSKTQRVHPLLQALVEQGS
jgi:hypothetical protein